MHNEAADTAKRTVFVALLCILALGSIGFGITALTLTSLREFNSYNITYTVYCPSNSTIRACNGTIAGSTLSITEQISNEAKQTVAIFRTIGILELFASLFTIGLIAVNLIKKKSKLRRVANIVLWVFFSGCNATIWTLFVVQIGPFIRVYANYAQYYKLLYSFQWVFLSVRCLIYFSIASIMNFITILAWWKTSRAKIIFGKITVQQAQKFRYFAFYVFSAIYFAIWLGTGIYGLVSFAAKDPNEFNIVCTVKGAVDISSAVISGIMVGIAFVTYSRAGTAYLIANYLCYIIHIVFFVTSVSLNIVASTRLPSATGGARDIIYISITWGCKIIFSLCWCVCYSIVAFIQYQAYSRSFYETAIKNADLGVPLVEDMRDEDFERDIEPWIIHDIKDLTFDSKISEGAFGVVFRGKYKGSAVAIKKMKMQEDDEEFQHEVRMLISLRHPNIVLFMGACLGAEFKIIVTEAMAMSLDHAIHKSRIEKTSWHTALTFEQKLQILIDVASAVLFMHSKQEPICHRDLKPSNILLDKHTTVAKICDFGTSRSVVASATMTGNIGTFMYMSPEVLYNKNYTEKCDSYSYGIIMYELFFEVRPYSMTNDPLTSDFVNPFLLGAQVTQGKRPHIPDLSEASEDEHLYITLMQKCWDNAPENRPSFEEILKDLMAIQNPEN